MDEEWVPDEEEPRTKRKRCRHDPEKIIAALLDVKAKKYSLRKAAQVYGIPHQTLSDKQRGLTPLAWRQYTILTPEEEAKLTNWIITLADQGIGKTSDDVRQKAKEILDLRNASSRSKTKKKPSSSWLYGFISRHPQLTNRAIAPCPDQDDQESITSEPSTTLTSLTQTHLTPFASTAFASTALAPSTPSTSTARVPPTVTVPAPPSPSVSSLPMRMSSDIESPRGMPSGTSRQRYEYDSAHLEAIKDFSLFLYDEIGRNTFINYFSLLSAGASSNGDQKFEDFRNLVNALMETCTADKRARALKLDNILAEREKIAQDEAATRKKKMGKPFRKIVPLSSALRIKPKDKKAAKLKEKLMAQRKEAVDNLLLTCMTDEERKKALKVVKRKRRKNKHLKEKSQKSKKRDSPRKKKGNSRECKTSSGDSTGNRQMEKDMETLLAQCDIDMDMELAMINIKNEVDHDIPQEFSSEPASMEHSYSTNQS